MNMSFSQYRDHVLLLLRLMVGAIFINHGLMKTGMWSAAPEGMSDTMVMIMKLLSIAEPLAGVALILGVLTPVASVGIAAVMISAMIRRLPNGDAFSKYEFEGILFLLSIAFIVMGPGKYSVDVWLTSRKK